MAAVVVPCSARRSAPVSWPTTSSSSSKALIEYPAPVNAAYFVRRVLRAAFVPWALSRVWLSGRSASRANPGFEDLAGAVRPVQLDQGLFVVDAAFYRGIAEHGYGAVGEGALRFFPLVPLSRAWSRGGTSPATMRWRRQSSPTCRRYCLAGLVHRLALR